MKQVVVCEDDDAFRTTLSQALAREFTVTEANCGRAALDKCLEVKPDVLVIDFSLPDLNANEVCKMIETDARYGAPRIIVMTGQYQESGKVDYKKSYDTAFTVDAYFNKPFDSELLIQRIKQLR